MSLLMEALKKAEEAKRLASGNTPQGAPLAASSELTLKPVSHSPYQASSTSSTPSGSPLPDLSLHIDSLDADLAAVSTDTPVKRRPSISHAAGADINPRETTERHAARNVFSAKQPPTNSRTGLWIVLGATVLLALGLGVYFWWQLQRASTGSLTRSGQTAPQTPPQPMRPTPASPSAATAITEAAKPVQELLPQPTIPARQVAVEPPQSSNRSTRPPKASTPAPQANPDSPVRLSRNQPKPNQTLEQAYDALQAGRLDEAQHGYEMVLRSDAKNTDALLGMATIAANQGHAEQAQAYYLRALESDPSDATAQAGLINIRGLADPGLSESRLRMSLARQPESSALHFALGNLYARQARWSEAQQAYFNAYSTEPDNPDFIFNLAVSLDHLRQNKLAIQYYQMALNTAGKNSASHAVSFDKNQVSTRILELQP